MALDLNAPRHFFYDPSLLGTVAQYADDFHRLGGGGNMSLRSEKRATIDARAFRSARVTAPFTASSTARLAAPSSSAAKALRFQDLL